VNKLFLFLFATDFFTGFREHFKAEKKEIIMKRKKLKWDRALGAE